MTGNRRVLTLVPELCSKVQAVLTGLVSAIASGGGSIAISKSGIPCRSACTATAGWRRGSGRRRWSWCRRRGRSWRGRRASTNWAPESRNIRRLPTNLGSVGLNALIFNILIHDQRAYCISGVGRPVGDSLRIRFGGCQAQNQCHTQDAAIKLFHWRSS